MSRAKRKTPPKTGFLAALDIGATKVCCAIARLNENVPVDEKNPVDFRIIGVGYQHSRGMRGSHIIDIESLEDSILNALHTAEQQAMRNVSSVYVNLPAGITKSHIIRNTLELSNTPANESHLKRLLTLGRGHSFGNDRQLIHLIPLSYELDGVRGIRDPRGMLGQKLTAILHVMTAPQGLINNLMACIGRCHLDIKAFVSSPYAAGLATLVEDELELGVTVIDMGGGHTTIASFLEGSPVFIASVPVGGALITQDIARGLSTPIVQAERLKTLYGSVLSSTAEERENIMVAQIGESGSSHASQVPKSMLSMIIRSRVEEIFELVQRKLQDSGVDPIVFQRIVLTGGACQIQGMREMAVQIMKRPVRIGTPNGITGGGEVTSNPSFATCAGLLSYSMQDYTSQNTSVLNISTGGFWNKMSHWFRQNF